MTEYPSPQDPFATTSHQQAPKRRPRLWLVALLAVPLSAAIVAVGVLVPKALKDVSTADSPAKAEPKVETSFAPQPFSAGGFMTLELGKFVWDSASGTDKCTGYKGYDDIKAGTEVLVSDPAGKTIALGSLGDGLVRRDPDNTSRALECRFPFKVTGIPGGHQFYGLEIGRRGKLTYARDRLGNNLELHLN